MMKSNQLFYALVVLMILFSVMGSPSHAYARETSFALDPLPKGSIAFDKSEINRGGKAKLNASLALDQIPPEGYTSVEFNCTYPADFNIVVLENIIIPTNDPDNLYVFGKDPAVAIQGPANGRFIVAIAGTNGQKAVPQISTTGGKIAAPALARSPTVFTIDARSPTNSAPTQQPFLITSSNVSQVQTTPTPRGNSGMQKVNIDCQVRAFTETDKKGVKWILSATLKIKDESEPTVTPTPAFTFTPPPSPFFTAVATTIPVGTMTGQVFAGKLVTINLIDATGVLVRSMPVNPDGTFNLTVPAGRYTIIAAASGFLNVQSTVTIAGNEIVKKGTATLVPGDIDGNNSIDQFDAITIGMNYNLPTPSGADLNNDGVINVLDLEILATNYRKTGPIDFDWQ